MLKRAIDAYLAVRRSVGFKLRDDEILLHSFLRFATKRGDRRVTTKTAIAWAAASSSPDRRECRLRVVRRFAQHVRAEDPAHELPPEYVFARRRHLRPPYIYSRDEIQRLLAAAARLRSKGPRGSTYYTLFGLLACTGLRVSEALALKLDDVTADGLVIRETKFRKSRLVPLHPTAARALGRYLERRRAFGATCQHVFVLRRTGGIHYKTVLRTFWQIVRDIGLGRADRRPRIHDLRHTFAVRALERSPEGRDQVGRHMRALSTYLGHVSIASTYWYLQATPQLMTDMADACEAVVEKEAS